MARIEAERRITIDLKSGGPDPVLILREPTEKELIDFLKSRWPRRGNKVEDNGIEARRRFIDLLLVGCEEIEVKVDGNWIVLTPSLTGWKERIPLNWKISAASKFEEQETLSPEDEKN